jgi:hypothetical protein
LKQQGQVSHILQFSQLPENAERMLFGNIVTDLALREYLGYQIPVDKVAWDCQGNPKKPYLPSKKVVSGSPARPPSKKSWAHKNVGASNKLAVDPKPCQKDVVIGVRGNQVWMLLPQYHYKRRGKG